LPGRLVRVLRPVVQVSRLPVLHTPLGIQLRDRPIIHRPGTLPSQGRRGRSCRFRRATDHLGPTLADYCTVDSLTAELCWTVQEGWRLC
jgi:hypothetical protein